MKSEILLVVGIIFAVMSLITFILYGIDKLKAQSGGWRISEKILLGFSILGGAIGGFGAMAVFRHKTRHWYFYAVNIIGLVVMAGALGAIIFI